MRKLMMPIDAETAIHLRAAALKKRYAVFGQYYAFDFQKSRHQCRSILDLIADDKRPEEPTDLLNITPDLLVVMLNPGSSRPVDPLYQPEVLQDIAALSDFDAMVPAVPDTTQYQVMRLMAALGLHHARVLNLSDLRTPKSAALLDSIKHMGVNAQWHSIFSAQRHQELGYRTRNGDLIPVVVGWGRFLQMQSYARLCLNHFKEHAVFGVPVEGASDLFAHPSPMLQKKKEAWLVDILRHFQADPSR